ncbi:N-acetylmuramoyl-L-alanine amidase, partial [Candidatus Dojkabacteria bacterium]|nr:N-acetylmuramoyl-L-alanine amidase [Candidatus Dojkabacteria bacterium]
MYIGSARKPQQIIFLVAAFFVLGLFCGANKVAAQVPESLAVNTASTQVAIPDGYIAIAFKWQQGTNFQYSFDGINYSYPVLGDDETEKMADGSSYSSLVFVPGYSRVVRFRNSNAGVITINLIPGLATPRSSELYTGSDSVIASQVNLSSGANYSELPIIRRDLWGANESYLNWYPEYWQNTRIIVHHTVFDSSTGDYPAVVRSIYYYHAVTLGWGDIGYNYIIDPNGNIYEGRTGGEAAIGGHAYANNAGSIGISFIGDFSYKLPTEAALLAFKNLAAERAIINNFALNWGTTVTGHRDQPQNNTACPGTGLYNSLETITIEAEAVRQTLVGGTIDLARQNMETALAGYPDTRLKLTFTNSGLTDVEKLALIPKYSGIKSVSDVVSNTVTIEVESWSYYYGYWHDDTYDRVKMLYLIFSLDPSFSNIELLTDFAFVGSYPANTGRMMIGDNPYLLFSRAAAPGSGNIEIRKITDDSLVDTLDVNSAAVSFADRRVYLLPH